MKRILALIGLFSFSVAAAQIKDTAQFGKDSVQLEDVIVIGKKGLDYQKESKPLSTIDEYMENSGRINLIKRGGYAWEPMLNNMATERISVTIDGMKIFEACTDKMDPITSYVEISNLKSMQISSGLQSGSHSNNCMGGGIDMKLNKAGFDSTGWKTSVNTGYETNGNYFTGGGNAAYSGAKFYTNFGASYRKSGNYTAGGDSAIRFSQFQKANAYGNFGYRFSRRRTIEASVIGDDAFDVGYPALSMDVKTARAIITSLSYKKENISDILKKWETKLYFNTITHIMDDSKRPDVTIHMDMPGWSKTSGFYSQLNGQSSKDSFTVNLDGYYNQSKADMTMYPPGGVPAFMFTWPDVRTVNTGIYVEDERRLNAQNFVHLSSRLSYQRDGIASDFGLKSMEILYPNMPQYTNRFLFNVAAKYHYCIKDFTLMAGAGYGLRAPSVSEAYGYYLFNTFDNYDYIGNPLLKDEKSLEGNLSLALNKEKIKIQWLTSYFHFFDYIIGKPDASLSPMTAGAAGVKVYTNLSSAAILTSNLQVAWLFSEHFTWTNNIAYSLGEDNQNNPLPLIAPVMYASDLQFHKNKFSADIQAKGAAKHTRYAPEYGEGETPAYLIGNVSVGYDFTLGKCKLYLKVGMENIFDKRYTTYTDWNHILQKGRNCFVNLIFNF